MATEDEKEPTKTSTEVILAAVYAILLIGCTVAVQKAIYGFLSGFSAFVGGFIVSVFTFIFASIISNIGKGVLKFFLRKHFLSRTFVLAACLFILIVCVVLYGELLAWWLTAILGIIGTLIAFSKALLRRKVKKKLHEVRQMEHDLRHQSIHEAKDLVDRFRKGKF